MYVCMGIHLCACAAACACHVPAASFPVCFRVDACMCMPADTCIDHPAAQSCVSREPSDHGLLTLSISCWFKHAYQQVSTKRTFWLIWLILRTKFGMVHRKQFIDPNPLYCCTVEIISWFRCL